MKHRHAFFAIAIGSSILGCTMHAAASALSGADSRAGMYANALGLDASAATRLRAVYAPYADAELGLFKRHCEVMRDLRRLMAEPSADLHVSDLLVDELIGLDAKRHANRARFVANLRREGFRDAVARLYRWESELQATARCEQIVPAEAPGRGS